MFKHLSLTRKELKPNMFVRNSLSGKIGLTLPDPKNKKRLRRAHPFFVFVRTLSTKGEKTIRCWYLKNVYISLFQRGPVMRKCASLLCLPKEKSRKK